MRKTRLMLWAVLIVAAAAEAAPTVKTVVLQCRPGWRGTAVGQYGGVGFEVSCQNGRGTERLSGFTGTAYSIRVGVESDAVGGDCFYSGDAGVVQESCLDVRLSIR